MEVRTHPHYSNLRRLSSDCYYPQEDPKTQRQENPGTQPQTILRERQRRILDRIANRPGPERDQPMMTATNIHYELADRVQGLAAGGIGAMLLLARRTGLIADIDHNLHLLKRHLPYHESDHVLNIAFNILAGGKRIEHLELRRNDEVYLDALGAERHPRPHHRGGLLPPLRRARRRDPDGRHQSNPAAGLVPATRRRSSTRPSSTSTAPSSAPTPSASKASTSPTTAPGVIIPC